MFRCSLFDRLQWSQAVWLSPRRRISRRDGATRALAACLAAGALAAPAALADDLGAPDAFTRGARAPDWLSPDPRRAARPVAPTMRPRTPDATAVDVAPDRRFDWTSAAIGAGGAVALTVIALAGAATLTGRSRIAPHRSAPH
jgi:hypothetical protein